ncbi:MAG: ATP-binding protein [Bacteriovorax sp.]|nr:ATP-binding protein [Bacteriovorax sp.]
MRYLKPYIIKDLKKKMVFIGGPRQSGKTTLAKDILKEFKDGLYLNWDRTNDKKKILSEDWSKEEQLLVFDEIHKYPKWKNLIKGYYDSFKDDHQFIVTGSARLDLYKRGGDSLLGRYHYWRLHPFDLTEIPIKISKEEAFRRLLNLGGFPEPFLDNDEREAKRWREERYNRIIKDDIRDLENIKNIQQMSMLLTLLRERVGGLIVVSNLAQDLQVSPVTVAKWIEIFEKMYLIFTVKSYTHKLPRAISKPFKVYFFDNADVIGDQGAKFENLVATHLLKKCHFHQDYTGEKMELWFLRDKEHHEADFLLTNENKIVDIIETKWSDTAVSSSLLYFAEKLKSPSATQIVGELKKDSTKNNFKLRSAISYFSTLA